MLCYGPEYERGYESWCAALANRRAEQRRVSEEPMLHYVVGQRRGLEIGGSPEPLYVVRLEPDTRRVVVGPRTGRLPMVSPALMLPVGIDSAVIGDVVAAVRQF